MNIYRICKCRAAAGDNDWCQLHGKNTDILRRYWFKIALRMHVIKTAIRKIRWLGIIVAVNACASVAMFFMIVDLYKLNDDLGGALNFMAKIVAHLGKRVGGL